MTKAELNQLQELLDKLFNQFAKQRPIGVAIECGFFDYQITVKPLQGAPVRFPAHSVADCHHNAVAHYTTQQEAT